MSTPTEIAETLRLDAYANRMRPELGEVTTAPDDSASFTLNDGDAVFKVTVEAVP